MSTLDQLEATYQGALAALESAHDAEALRAWEIQYLGRKGAITLLLRLTGGLPAEQRAAFGQRANAIKAELTRAYAAREESLRQAALARILRRVAGHLQPIAEQIKQSVQASSVIGSDETGARIAGRNAWEWVFQTPTASYHTLQPTRSSDVIKTFMQGKRADVWVADLAPAQVKGGQSHAQQFALCGAHQLRDLQFAIDSGDTLFAPAFRRLLLEAKALSDRRAQMGSSLYHELVQCVHATCDALLLLQPTHEAGRKLQQRYRRHRPALFVFLDHADVPFDNNASERALRNSVIHRKVTGGFRSDWGADAFAVVTTIVQTARKNNRCLFETLRSLLTPLLSPLLQLRE